MDNWFLEELRFRKHERLAILGLVILILFTFLLRFVPLNIVKPSTLNIDQVLKIKEQSEAQALHEANEALKLKEKQSAYNHQYSQRQNSKYSSSKNSNSDYSNSYDKSKSKYSSEYNKYDKYNKKQKKANRQIFRFNPNDVSQDSLELLGFKSYIAERWVKFRNKGKKFYSLSDVKSIYGIDTILAESLNNQYDFPLKPIKKDYTTNDRKDYNKDYRKEEKHRHGIKPQYAEFDTNQKYKAKKEIPLASIDLNSALEDELMKIPGIGVSYSNRIIKYRSMLGGFYDKNQLKSVYGMTDSLYNVISKYLKIESLPAQIQINFVSEKELASHYLLSYKEAKIISAYKLQHGPFVGPEDFRKLMALSDEKKETIIPYIDFKI